MQYLIDDANLQHIDDVIETGIRMVTANPTMYRKNNITLSDFITTCKQKKLSFLSGEICSDELEDMKLEAEQLINIYPEIVIKINFSKNGLKLCEYLHQMKVKTALTLVFQLPQVLAAMNAHADYIFFFIGRNDETGVDGMELLVEANRMTHNSNSYIVAASIKNLHHLQQLCKSEIPYAAIPYDLYMKSLYHPLTEVGISGFKEDFQQTKQSRI